MGYISYTTFRDATHSFAGVAAYKVDGGTLGEGASSEQILLGEATSDFFPLLGVHTHIGRFFNEDEDRPYQAVNTLVLGYGLWTRRFAADPGVLGRAVRVNGQMFTVVGVAPRGFTGAELGRVDAWEPMSVASQNVTAQWTTTWNAQWLRVVARLKPGIGVAQAEPDATEALHRAYTGTGSFFKEGRIRLAQLRYNGRGKEPLEASVSRWLSGVTLIVLLIACANVISLYLVRMARRRQEVAVRLALGIGRGRLVRLLMLHGLLLTTLGGLLALLIARAGVWLVRTRLLPDVDWTSSSGTSRMLVFTAIAALATAVLTSLLPALRSVRPDLSASLRSGARDGGGRNTRLRSALTVLQAALCVVLLVGAGLFARSLANATGLHLGFEADRALIAYVTWPTVPNRTPEQQQQARARNIAWYDQALQRARTMRDVEAAAVAVGTPFGNAFGVELRVAGYDSIPELKGGGPYIAAVSDGYFEAVGTHLLRGRLFTAADRQGSEPVAIVSQVMASTLWPQADALGQCLYISDKKDAPAPCSRIVGVVEDARRNALREDPAMQYYIPRGQERGFGGPALVVRPRGPAERFESTLRAQLGPIDPSVESMVIATMQESVDPLLRPWRLGTVMFGVFAGFALLIAAIGMYSVIAYSVTSRLHELGVRMALGARRADVVAMVLGEGARLVLAGLLLGSLLALAVSARVASLLFEASPRDPRVFGGVAVVMLAVALLACLLPARRAARVDPVRALRVL